MWTTLVLCVVAAASLAAGPAMLTAAERTTRTRLAASTGLRLLISASISAITATLCWAGWSRLGTTPIWLAWCWACALACGLVLADLRCRRLPLPLVTMFAAGGAAVLLVTALVDGHWFRLGFACAASAAVFTVATLVQWWAPEHTGGGDSTLYGAIAFYSAWFGWEGVLRGLLVASGLTALVALAVAVWSGSAKSRFPAGPSLLAGTLVSILLA